MNITVVYKVLDDLLYLVLERYDFLLQHTQQGYKLSQHFIVKAVTVDLNGL